MVAGLGAFNEAEVSSAAREPPSQLIHILHSDGDTSHRPTQDQRDRTARGGQVNYHRSVNVNEAASRNWREKIGTYLARELGYDLSQPWYLADWPQDYELFVQVKGLKDNPRHDLYLFGGKSKYRSANEFNPHALWLFKGDSSIPCHCQHCSGTKSQREINWRLGLSNNPVIAAPGNASTSWGDSIALNKPKRRVQQSSSRPLTTSARQDVISFERESDLRTNHIYRSGELVWCRLDEAIVGEYHGLPAKIEWWPAIVQERGFEPGGHPQAILKHATFDSTIVYRVKFLGVSANGRFRGWDLLPYHAHLPNDCIVECIKFAPAPPFLSPDLGALSRFSPLLNSFASSPPTSSDDLIPLPSRTLYNALAPYGLAVLAASHIIRHWCPSDKYDFIFSQTGPDSPNANAKQTRHQGVWWGSERIWVGDLVRIKPSRSELLGELLPSSSATSEARGLLVRITAIYIQDIPILTPEGLPDGANNTRKDIFFAGQLFECADLNPELPQQVADLPPGTHGAPFQHPMPPPPPGCMWRMLTPSIRHDIHLHLSLLAGRYYPTLLHSPMISDVLNPSTVWHYIQSGRHRRTVPSSHVPLIHADLVVQKILALSGLATGVGVSGECSIWSPNRTSMFQQASSDAKKELFDYWMSVSSQGRLSTPPGSQEGSVAPLLGSPERHHHSLSTPIESDSRSTDGDSVVWVKDEPKMPTDAMLRSFIRGGDTLEDAIDVDSYMDDTFEL